MKLMRSIILLALAGVLLASSPLLAADGPNAPIVGTWMGTLTVMGTQLRIAFNFSLAGDGSSQTVEDGRSGHLTMFVGRQLLSTRQLPSSCPM